MKSNTYDILLIEIGSDLIHIADPEFEGTLVDKIGKMRIHFSNFHGMILPPIRIRNNPKLKPKDYTIYLRNILIGEYSINELTTESISDSCTMNIINHLYKIIERYKKVLTNL